MTELEPAVRYVLGGPHLCVLATVNPDGTPQTSVIFVELDGDTLLFSTIRGRRKADNMVRDPRVSLLLHGLPADQPNEAGDAPNYVTVSGTVEIADDPGGAYHQALYDRYMPETPRPPEPLAQRVVVRILPRRVYVPTFASIYGRWIS